MGSSSVQADRSEIMSMAKDLIPWEDRISRRQDLSIGLAYYQFFTPRIGAFLTAAFGYSAYRTASEHIPNDSAPMDFIEEKEYGVLAELGVISRSGSMYFRLGFSGYYDLYHRESAGYRLALVVGGGVIIGGY